MYFCSGQPMYFCSGVDTDKTAFVRVTLNGASQVSVLVNDVQEDLIRNIVH